MCCGKKNTGVNIFRFNAQHIDTAAACEDNFQLNQISHEKKLVIGRIHLFDLLKNRMLVIYLPESAGEENIDELEI